MDRKTALRLIESYTASGDNGAALRIYCENRVSRKAFDEARAKGMRLAQMVTAQSKQA